MIQLSREDLETQNIEQRERIEFLEAQVAAMLANPRYKTPPLGLLRVRVPAPDSEPVSHDASTVEPSIVAEVAAAGCP